MTYPQLLLILGSLGLGGGDLIENFGRFEFHIICRFDRHISCIEVPCNVGIRARFFVHLSSSMLTPEFVITFCTLEKQYRFEQQGFISSHKRVDINNLGYMSMDTVR